ncbi:hypothetical protein QFC19_002109 [Naganishia cerealis]|uniref:Uncharacterized protein n=1 Tax=Naganishia cerealis TaxID=610337 RepID=A0ACC2WE39_9TREE|nr:hypothetical protein QFC19_002109 [Naganishia cerealis]
MWPSKYGLGAQVGYGVRGNGIIRTQEGRRLPQVEFPSLDNGIDSDENIGVLASNETFPSLKPVKGSLRTVVEPQTSDFDLNSTIFNDLLSDPLENLYIPQDILKSYLIESGSLTSTIAYDPTIGPRFCIFPLRSRSNTSTSTGIAYVSGEVGTVLNLSIMKISCIDSEQEIQLSSPHFDVPFQLTFSEPIKQVACSNVAGSLLIRTFSRVYVVQPFQSSLHRSGIYLELLGQVKSSSLNQESFADACFNPWDPKQVALVDVKGHFGVWNFCPNGKSDPKRVNISASESFIDNVQELSHWKKICFFAPEVMFVFSRSSLTQCTIGPPSQCSRLMTSNTWSSILDFQRAPADLKYSFMLTSRELIWFENDGTLKRLISYKHFLDERDPSWKLNVCSVDSTTFICIIFSQKAPLYFLYTFGLKSGLPYSLRSPYYIRSLSSYNHEARDNVLQLHVFPIDNSSSKIFGMFELHTDFGLHFRFLSTTKIIKLGDTVVTDGLWSRSGTPVETGKGFCRHMSAKDWKKLVEQMLSKVKTTSSDSTAIQEFALKIGEWALAFDENLLRNEANGSCSLLDISENPPTNVRDIDEFDSMIEQLGEYFKLKQFELSRESEDLLRNRLNSLRQYYGKEQNLGSVTPEILNRTTLELGCSIYRAKHSSTNQAYEEKFKEVIQEASDEVKSILGDWESGIVVADVTTQPDIEPSEIMPTININSSQSQSSLFAPLSQGTQLNSQTQSQAHRSQRRHKMSQGSQRSQRKKRKGGFA